MSFTVEHNGATIEFPDGTPQDVVLATLGVQQKKTQEREPPVTVTDQLQGYGQDALSGLTALPRGFMQAVAGGVGGLGAVLGDVSGMPNALEEYGYAARDALRDDEQYRRDNETSMPLRLASELATGVGATKGVQLGEKALEQIAKGAGLGFGFGAATPATSDAEKATQLAIGTAGGGAVPAAINTLTKVPAKIYTEGRKLVDPYLPGGHNRLAGRAVVAAAGDDAIPLAQALERRAGDPRTAGQVAAKEFNNPKIPGIEQNVRKHMPKEYLAVKQAQVGDRQRLLDEVGTAEKAERLAANRAAKAGQEYGAANKIPVESNAQLSKLLSDPYAREAGKLGARQAQSEGLIPWHGEVPPEHATRYLHLVKEGFDKMLSRTGDEALDRTAARTVRGLQKDLTRWLGDENPAYQSARTRFAARSRGVDRASIGSELRKAIDKPFPTASERGASFANALRDAPKTIKTATGSPRYKELAEVLSKKQMQNVGRVKSELDDFAVFEEQAKAGAFAARDALDSSLTHLDDFMPRILDRTIVIIRNALGRIRGSHEQLTREEVSRLLLPENKMELAKAIRDVEKNASAAEKKELFDLLTKISSVSTKTGALTPIATQGIENGS